MLPFHIEFRVWVLLAFSHPSPTPITISQRTKITLAEEKVISMISVFLSDETDIAFPFLGFGYHLISLVRLMCITIHGWCVRRFEKLQLEKDVNGWKEIYMYILNIHNILIFDSEQNLRGAFPFYQCQYMSWAILEMKGFGLCHIRIH